MGITTIEHDEQSGCELAAVKPKERQFQVVPVPGTFTRGRWKCWDYKEKAVDMGAIEFTEKSDKVSATINIVTDMSTMLNKAAHQGETLNHTVSEPQFPTTDLSGASVTQPITVPKTESSTILVTSIAPPSVTPVHGTPSSTNISPVLDVVTQETSDAVKMRTVPNIRENNDFIDNNLALNSTISAPSISNTASTVIVQSNTEAKLKITPIAGSTVNFQSSPEAADIQRTQSGILFGADNSSEMTNSVIESEELPPTGASSGGPNVVAIDNKIEQAMDLVKTHLTFAVREEVEILRLSIVELEAKVAQLEGENQVLKQFAPAEVVQSLSLLVQKQLQPLQSSSAPVSTVPSQSLMLNVTQQNITALSIPDVEPLVMGSTSAPMLAELQTDAAAAVAEQTAKMADAGVIAREF